MSSSVYASAVPKSFGSHGLGSVPIVPVHVNVFSSLCTGASVSFQYCFAWQRLQSWAPYSPGDGLRAVLRNFGYMRLWASLQLVHWTFPPLSVIAGAMLVSLGPGSLISLFAG